MLHLLYEPKVCTPSSAVLELTAALNDSQKLCHMRGSPEMVGRFDFGSRLTGVLAVARFVINWLGNSVVRQSGMVELVVGVVGFS